MPRFKYSLLAAAGILILALVMTALGPKRVMAALGYTPVRDVDNPARATFQDSFSLEIDPGHSSDKNESFAVNIPPNTRLAIDHINVLGELPVGQRLVGVNVDAFVGGSASGDFVGTDFHGTSPSGVIFGGPLDIYSGDQVSALFADSG